jgi:type IV secretory pathway VirB10-like protein
MKHLAFWIVLGVVLIHFAGRRDRHARARADENAPRPTLRRVAVSDDPPAAPRPPAKPQGRARLRPVPPTPPAPPALPAPPAVAREPRQQPDWFPKTPEERVARAKGYDSRGSRVLVGQISSTEPKAKAELRQKLDAEVKTWLAGDVPPSWKPPTRSIDAMIQSTYVEPEDTKVEGISKELDETYTTLYRAGALVDFSQSRRAQLLKIYDREVVRERMIKGGGLLAFVLITLGGIAGYIRADEATKGYYTNRLRMLAAAGVGGAGVALYHMFA